MNVSRIVAIVVAYSACACSRPVTPSPEAPTAPASARDLPTPAPAAPASVSASGSAAAPVEKPTLSGGTVRPPADGPNACVAKGGICASGARCTGQAAGRYMDLATLGDETCGGAGAGMVCCVKCTVAPDSPDSCCGATYGATTVCVDGKVGCTPGQTGIRKGEKCPWER